MAQGLPFGEVLEAADQLSPDEQEELISVLHLRLAHAARPGSRPKSRRRARSSPKAVVRPQRPAT